METINLSKLAGVIQAYKNCIESKNFEWEEKHLEYINNEAKKLPYGSGFDVGCEIDLPKCTDIKIVILTSFHVMDECGYYSGWQDYKVIVTPEFGYFHVKVQGSNKQGLKYYVRDVFYNLFTI